MNYTKHIAVFLACLILFYTVLFMSIDAYEMENTGSCDECLILKGWFQWVENRTGLEKSSSDFGSHTEKEKSND